MTAEEWRPVPGSEDRYLVSSLGRVRSRQRILSQHAGTRGYLQVRLDGATRAVHVVVATAFCGPRPTPSHEVNHVNGRRTDNASRNLEWLELAEHRRRDTERRRNRGKGRKGKKTTGKAGNTSGRPGQNLGQAAGS